MASVVFLLSVWQLPAIAKSPQQIFSEAANSIVIVNTFNSQGRLQLQGSGVIFETGKVVTNCHVVEKGDSISVLHAKRAYVARLEISEAKRHMCRLVVFGLTGSVANLGTAENVQVGARVYAIGAPQGFELSMSEDIVSSLREIDMEIIIQTTAAISHGSSGGGLFDEHGNLIGITTFTINDSQNLNFALPANWITELPLRLASQVAAEREQQAKSQQLKAEREIEKIAEERQKLRRESEALAQERQRLEKVRQLVDEQNQLLEERRYALKHNEPDTRALQGWTPRNEYKSDTEQNAKAAADKARQAAEQAKALKAEYISKIKAKIESNTSAVEGATGTLRAEFKIVLLPTGEVLSARLLKSSGNKAYDDAVERGIAKSVPLPLPPNNPELFREFRELRLPFTYERNVTAENRTISITFPLW